MGIINRGILGGFSGKVANVIGGSWKGIAYMRSQPLSVANPQTAAQTGQRLKFSTIQAIAQLLLVAIIKPLMDRFAGQMSGFNYFIQQNIAAVSTSGVVTWANLRISIGSLLGVDTLEFTAVDNSPTVTANFNDNSSSGNASATDLFYGAFYWVEGDEWAFSSGVETRDSGSATATFSDQPELGDTIHVYAAFRKADGTLVSNTSYLNGEVGEPG